MWLVPLYLFPGFAGLSRLSKLFFPTYANKIMKVSIYVMISLIQAGLPGIGLPDSYVGLAIPSQTGNPTPSGPSNGKPTTQATSQTIPQPSPLAASSQPSNTTTTNTPNNTNSTTIANTITSNNPACTLPFPTSSGVPPFSIASPQLSGTQTLTTSTSSQSATTTSSAAPQNTNNNNNKSGQTKTGNNHIVLKCRRVRTLIRVHERDY